MVTFSKLLLWEDKLGLRRSIVLFVTLWMTWKAFAWAGEYAYAVSSTSGLEIAAIIAAVTAPISYLQIAVFKAYIESKT
jgi:hypothetical protein